MKCLKQNMRVFLWGDVELFALAGQKLGAVLYEKLKAFPSEHKSKTRDQFVFMFC